MSEEKKLDEKKLEGVTGGWDIYDGRRAITKEMDCGRCVNYKTDVCPYRNDMKAYYNNTEYCKLRRSHG